MQKVVFFFPWKKVGGGPYYLCGLADGLAATGKYEVYYVDYYNGLSDDILTDFRVRKIPYLWDINWEKSQSMELFCNEPIILVIPIYWVFHTPKMHPNSKIILINWHNMCIPVLKNNWKTTPDIIGQFFHMLTETNSVCFCDITHWMTQQEYGIICKEQYVPVNVSKRNIRALKGLVDPDTINIAILGSMSADKVYSAIDVVENLSCINTEKSINVHVIGEGTESNRFFEHYYGEKIRIIRYGVLEISEILKVLSEKTDVLFAMGTSALDGASIGLPTYIIPNEMYPFECNRYVLLSQTKGYALGWSVKQLEQLDLKCWTIEQVIEEIYLHNRKDQLGGECLHFCTENFTNNRDALIRVAESSSFTYSKLSPLILKRLSAKEKLQNFIGRIKETLGMAVKKFVLCGLPVFTLANRAPGIYNFFLLGIPFLRLQEKKIPKAYSIQLLPFVWIYKGIRNLIVWFRRLFAPGLTEQKTEIVPSAGFYEIRTRIDKKLIQKEKIRICLFEPRISCWKFGNLYRIMEESGIFEPIVVVTPFMTSGYEAMVKYMDETYEQLSQEGYQVIKGYDKKTNVFLDIKETLHPDAVIYSMYWKNHFQQNSYITNFEDIYTFLYPYGFDAVWYPDRAGLNYELQQKVTRYYMPTKIHKGLAEDNMDNHGRNVYVTGSPQLDYLLDSSYEPKDIWKSQRVRKKRIIWAPHHSFENQKPYAKLSAFLDLYDFMLEVAELYKDSVQFAFKPHPMLKPRLVKLWGKSKTEKYYRRWADGENTQFQDGAFIDLFLTSDAMIMDSVSFMTEYTVIDKPVFFTYGKDTRFPLNRYGRAISKVLYRNENFETLYDDIINYIEQVVLKGNDSIKAQREEFIEKYLLPDGEKTAAENIYDDICRVILEGKCLEYKLDWD